MNGKVTKVLLVVPADNIQRDFEITHAERILAMRKNGGWQLPKDSIFEYDKNNGIRRKANKGKNNGK